MIRWKELTVSQQRALETLSKEDNHGGYNGIRSNTMRVLETEGLVRWVGNLPGLTAEGMNTFLDRLSDESTLNGGGGAHD